MFFHDEKCDYAEIEKVTAAKSYIISAFVGFVQTLFMQSLYQLGMKWLKLEKID